MTDETSKVCTCFHCGPPWRTTVPNWREQSPANPFYGASWDGLCPSCGSKRCPGAVQHDRHRESLRAHRGAK